MLRDYPQILNKIRSTPWCITEGGLRTILEIVDARMSGIELSDEEVQERLATAGSRRNSGSVKASGGVGVIPIHGPIFGKANMMTQLSGATSIETLQQDFRALMQNDQVGSILLDVDSPGGVSDLVLEFGEEIREARDTKPVYSIANTQAGSAAYWLHSQATKGFVTPSGSIGSIGVFAVHENDDRKLKEEGIDRTIIKAGRFKAEMAEPMTPELEDYIQGRVNACHEQFIDAVAKGRGVKAETVRSKFGEGRMLSAKDALSVGMVDGVNTFDEVLGDLLDGGGSVVQLASSNHLRATSSGADLRASLDKEKEHSEPGTGVGGEPEPRKDPEDEHIDDWRATGGRLQRPPNIPELEASVMNREALLKYATRLGISDADSLTDEELSTKVSAALDSSLDLVQELQTATEAASKQVAFAQAYPEEAGELARLKAEGQVNAASTFAHDLADFKVAEGEGDARKETSFRLSTLAQEVVKDAHLKLAQGNFQHDDLKNLIHSVATGGVQQGEQGSSRYTEEVIGSVPTGDIGTDRKAFTAKVEELMTNDNLDRKAAIAEAAVRYPELAQAYARS